MAKKPETMNAAELGRAAARVDVNTDAQWKTLHEKARPILEALPHKDGAVDRNSEAFKTFRAEFKEGACEGYAASGEYDLELHRASENEFYMADVNRPANYRLTGAAALMDRAEYAALPNDTDDTDDPEAPKVLKHFVTLQRERIKGRADTALSRLLKKPKTVADMLDAQGKPRTVNTFGDALCDLYKDLENKRAKANQLIVCSKEELRAAISLLIKTAIKK